MNTLQAAAEPPKRSWLERLRAGLGKTSTALAEGITGIFTRRKLDAEALEDLEALLIASDMGVETAGRLGAQLRKERFDKEVTDEEVKEALAAEIEKILIPSARAVEIDASAKPYVMMVVGVNGNGKTTTIGKMAHMLRGQGWCVALAAADTFRAAAVAQLKVWGGRTGCQVHAGEEGADAASVVYRAYEEARAAGADVLLIDTAGRLQNKTDLMAELQKITRVLKKHNPALPHAVILILDATTGQNAHSQVEIFKEISAVTGLVVTKLDGTAKGGVVVALAQRFGLPIHAVGVGEGIEDLRSFSARDFARNCVGL